MQYLIFGCLSSKLNYLDNSAHREQNLDLKWSISQKITKHGKRLFISFTVQKLQESNSLPHNSLINNSNKFPDSLIHPTQFSVVQKSKMSKFSINSPASDPGNASISPTSAESSGTNSLASKHSSVPIPIPIDSKNLADFHSKYNLDISDLYAKYCLEPLETTKKRKAPLETTTSNFVSASAPGFAIIRDIITSTANFPLGLPLANDLLNAIVSAQGRLPALRAAIDEIVISQRNKARQNQDIINGMAHDIEALINSVQESNAPYINSYLVTLSFAILQIGKLVKLSFPSEVAADRARMSGGAMAADMATNPHALPAGTRKQNLDVLYAKKLSSNGNQAINELGTAAKKDIVAMRSVKLVPPPPPARRSQHGCSGTCPTDCHMCSCCPGTAVFHGGGPLNQGFCCD